MAESLSNRSARLAVYAGVFDPPTLAHLEIVQTALGLFDRLLVVVASNMNKAPALFTAEERVELIRASLDEHQRELVNVQAYAGLVAPYARSLGACALVRGMRPGTDPDHEIALSFMNQKLEPTLPTVLLVSSTAHVYLSSSFVRETVLVGGQIVPGSVSAPVEAALRRKIRDQQARNGELREAPSPTARASAD